MVGKYVLPADRHDRKTRFKALITEVLVENMDHTATITVGKWTFSMSLERKT